ncbi:glycoside hydrolase family protein, partial [Saccharomonospora saliphila]|uniref:family 43 glycosylhydrolase n=1 Tax=Saccharomonospora saliphila TaxID=369829 RepID=UPI000A07AFD5
MRSRRVRTAFAILAAAMVATSCTAGEVSDGPAEGAPHGEGAAPGGTPPGERAGTSTPQRLAVDSRRSSDGVVAAGGADAPYNYGPSLLVENGRVRMWWCSQYGSAEPAGDDILHAEAPTPDGPFTGPGGGIPRAVFSGDPGGFDAVHTCDPSVLRVDGTYYLYYTGAAGETAHGNAIGLATSDDGVHWTRVGDGPIVTPAHDTHRDNTYGAGQPAAVHVDGWFYLMFTDTTARAAGWNGAGQFVLRSPDPAFADGVEALGPDGFAPVPGTDAPRTASVVDAFSADLVFSDALGAFVVAHQTDQGTTLTFTGRDFTGTPYEPVVIDSRWQEGPGLLRRPDGHAPVSERAVCGRVPFDVVHATVLGRGLTVGLEHVLDL